MPTYGQQIRAERAKYRISQPELARQLGLNPATIIDIERERLGIDDATFNKVMVACSDIAEQPCNAAG